MGLFNSSSQIGCNRCFTSGSHYAASSHCCTMLSNAVLFHRSRIICGALARATGLRIRLSSSHNSICSFAVERDQQVFCLPLRINFVGLYRIDCLASWLNSHNIFCARPKNFRESAKGGVFLSPNVMKEEHSQTCNKHFGDP